MWGLANNDPAVRCARPLRRRSSPIDDRMAAIPRCHPAAGRFHPPAAGVWPNLHHPDKIFQYLEPAWRMLGHEGVYSWEWRYGIRGFLLPTLMARPVAIGDWIDWIARGAGLSRADS